MTRTTIIRFLNGLEKYPEYIKEYRGKSTLPLYIHETLIGLLLSDGGLEKSSPTSAARLNVIFGIKHVAYLMHLYNLFEPYTNNAPDIKEVYNKKTDSFNITIRFKTQSLPVFVVYYNMFYILNSQGNFVKCIPKNMEQLMTPVVLSHLIMGDGNFKKPDGIIRIYTNSFIRSDVVLLAQAITNKLHIKNRVVHDRNDQYIITIGKDQLTLVRSLILPYVHPCMLYKLGLEPNIVKFDYKNILGVI